LLALDTLPQIKPLHVHHQVQRNVIAQLSLVTTPSRNYSVCDRVSRPDSKWPPAVFYSYTPTAKAIILPAFHGCHAQLVSTRRMQAMSGSFSSRHGLGFSGLSDE